MEARDPLSAHPYALERLTDDEWEELTFLLAWGEDRRVERLRAPDGGLDTVLPRPLKTSEAERGWQGKHYPGAKIHWDKCIESLDRAVRLWKVSHLTFTFPRDLSRDERVAFSEKLEGRHEGVTVDVWSGSTVRARLSADQAGERAARRFFGQSDPIEVIERAMRAGGELSRGEHAVDREFAVDEFVQGADPHFAWVIHKAPKNAPEPPQTAGAMMRLLFSRGESRMYVDAVPRSSSAAEGYAPKVNVVTDDSAEGLEARRLMADLLESGGRVRLRSGVSLALDRLPKPFGDMLTEPLTGDLTVKAVPMAEPWYAQLEVQSDLGRGGLEVDLVPVDPPDEWDSEWRGSRAGLSMEIRARWSVNDGRGETGLKLHYRAQPAPNADRVAALQAMVALHGTGSMRVVDRTGSRTTMETPIEGRPVPTELVELLGLAEALSEIERYSGRPAPAIPEETTLAEIDGLKRVAQTLRGGGEMVRLQDATLTGDHTMVERIRRSGSDIEIREKAFVRVFGREISIGERVMKLPLMKVKEARRTGRARDDPWDILLVPVHAEEVEVWMEFLPLAARDPKGPTPSTTEDQARD